MNKLIRDGKVAVIISPEYGAGWYTWHGVEELLYDPEVVRMIENGVDSQDIMNYCNETYGENHYYGGATCLRLVWMDEGTEFKIDEYDGLESVEYKKDFKLWMTA
jgi:hypothetical protein